MLANKWFVLAVALFVWTVYFHTIDWLIMEGQGLPVRAVVCYRRGIEVDDLIETFYQRLMLCLDQSGRQPEALACYRQCEHVLGIALGLQPTEKTRQIYQSILSQYSQLAG